MCSKKKNPNSVFPLETIEKMQSTGAFELIKLRNRIYNGTEKISAADKKELESLLICIDKFWVQVDFFVTCKDKIKDEDKIIYAIGTLQMTEHLLRAARILEKYETKILSESVECCHPELYENIKRIREEGLKYGNTAN